MLKVLKYFTYIVGSNKKKVIVISMFLVFSTILNIAYPILTQRIIDDGFLNNNPNIIIAYAIFIFSLYLIGSLINIVNENIRIKIEQNIRRELNDRAFNHLLALKIDYYENKNSSELFGNIECDINAIVGLVDTGVMMALTQGLSFVGGVIGLSIIAHNLIWLVIIFVPIKWVSVKYFAKRKENIMTQIIENDAQYTKWFANVLGGIKEIKLFSTKTEMYKEYHYYYDKVIESNRNMQKLDEKDSNVSVILTQLLITLLYIIGAVLVGEEVLSVGSILAFINFSVIVVNPIFIVLNIRYSMAGIIPSIVRFESFLQWNEESDNKSDLVIKSKDLELVFQDVTFGYVSGKHVFDRFSLHIASGEKIAIVGENGCGKTTLIELLLRLYEPITGEILLGGRRIQDYSLEAYRKQFAVVSQEVYLFNDSIENNIKLGSDIENSKILEILRECGLEKYAEKTKIKMIVGENGSLLSGGEKQKISLVRAIVRDVPIIILDEVTANMDAKSYLFLKQLLDGRLQKKTVICISHESELIEMFDRIVKIN